MTSAQEPKWIGKAQTLYIHEQSIARHGGRAGMRDEGMLESALARPENFFTYGETDLFILAAAYAEGLARNHAFVDGNKRTAYTVAGLFLHLNGWTLGIPDIATQIRLFEDVAAGKVTRVKLAAFYRKHCLPRS
ncbi:MAG: type II toxin-antitoxin system death-on-curing family toxin [Candidatus Cloacimonetes bacterium]|nr:type II toxin-antitoxin system death-on-curing family toxin [Candidatus Cloacimonadota bacterium]